MYLIVNRTGRYLKLTTDNKAVFTANEILAETFNSEREATDFIRKHFTKKKRRYYRPYKCDNSNIIQCNSNDNSQTADDIESELVNLDNCTSALQETIDTYLTPKIEKYTSELKKYDGMILDIRHYLRDEHTKLNACQGYKVASVLQELERGRADCKKELQRFAMLKSSVIKACSDSKAFEYDEYKNREIENVAEFIFSH